MHFLFKQKINKYLPQIVSYLTVFTIQESVSLSEMHQTAILTYKNNLSTNYELGMEWISCSIL